MLLKSGMRTVQTLGLPEANLRFDDVDAVVIALKSRTAPVDEAIAELLAALHALRELGCQQFYFKYCSTFDSTPAGNIGPVAGAQEPGACPRRVSSAKNKIP
jgi:3-dehydrotetronate 4-kinase